MIFTDIEDAIAYLDQPHKRAEWLKYQVDYPDTQVGPFLIKKYKIGKGSEMRRKNITLHALQRDTGYGTFRKLVELRPEAEDPKDRRVLWMSDTRAEILEHEPMLEKLATTSPKRVLINGLGLGIIAKAALNTPGVEHVDVVDINADIIELVGGFLKDPRLTIHLADAYEIEWPAGTSWDLAWHDIWPTISEDNLPEMYMLRNKYRSMVGWQDCWQIQGCREMADVGVRIENKTLPPEEALLILAGFSARQARNTKIDWSK